MLYERTDFRRTSNSNMVRKKQCQYLNIISEIRRIDIIQWTDRYLKYFSYLFLCIFTRQFVWLDAKIICKRQLKIFSSSGCQMMAHCDYLLAYGRHFYNSDWSVLVLVCITITIVIQQTLLIRCKVLLAWKIALNFLVQYALCACRWCSLDDAFVWLKSEQVELILIHKEHEIRAIFCSVTSCSIIYIYIYLYIS